MYDLSRFTAAHQRSYSTALAEMQAGYKRSHWIWYIFPQIEGLGRSSTAQYYSIRDLGEAQAFLADPYLGTHLREISAVLLTNPGSAPYEVMGPPDDLKLRSSMTLFSIAAPDEPVFQQVLDKYYNGIPDRATLRILGRA